MKSLLKMKSKLWRLLSIRERDVNKLHACLIRYQCIVFCASFPSGLCHKALSTAILLGDEIVIPDYVREELVETIERKFPNKMPDILPFLETISHVSFSSKTAFLAEGLPKLRDEKDQPVLTAAIMTGCDFILTGDRDFLESGISCPQPIHPKDYLEMLLLRF